MITQQQDPPIENTRKRKPPTCRICKCTGHQMRTCNDATLLSQRKHVFEQIENHAPAAEIITYAQQNHEFERMKIITYKTPKGKTSNICPLSSDETTYYTNLERYIQTEYEKQTNQLITQLQRRIFFTRRLLPHNANELMNRYINFLAQFYNNQHTIEDLDRELTQFLHLCETQSLEPTHYNPYPSYEILQRWNHFLQETTSRYMAQIQARNRPPPQIVQTYNYIKRRVPNNEPTESIDCPICMETVNMSNISETNCGHKFCSTCIRNTIKKYIATKRCPCPMCREPLHTIVRKFTE
jgi:hypothetical protein